MKLQEAREDKRMRGEHLCIFSYSIDNYFLIQWLQYCIGGLVAFVTIIRENIRSGYTDSLFFLIFHTDTPPLPSSYLLLHLHAVPLPLLLPFLRCFPLVDNKDSLAI